MTSRGASSSTRTRPMRRDDLDFVVDQHRSHFPTNVIGRFGGGLLRCYYASFLDSPETVTLLVQQGSQRVGYLVGILDTAAHRHLTLRRHGSAMAVHAAIACLRHPRLATGLLVRRLRLRLNRRADAAPADNGSAIKRGRDGHGPSSPIAVLSHIVVLDGARGSGTGKALVEEFARRARAHGAGVICLATLDEPWGAASFYDALGWHMTARRRTFDGRDILLYELSLT